MQLPHKLLAIRTANVIDTPLSITNYRKLARLCLNGDSLTENGNVTICFADLNVLFLRRKDEALFEDRRREYSLVLLDMNLVRTASSEGLRWLARLKEAADWHNVTLLTRLSPALALVFRSGFTLPKFTPARLAGAELA